MARIWDNLDQRREDEAVRIDLAPSNSVIIHPTGKILAGPAQHEETILYAEVDLVAVRAARRLFDPVGHYSRPDIFQLRVDTSPRPHVVARQTSPNEAPAEATPTDRWPAYAFG